MPHGQNLRKGRVSLTCHVYLVTTVTHQRHPFFEDLQTGRLLVTLLRRQHQQCVLRSLAFVIMPDHLHWLIQVGPQQELSRIINFTKTMSARRINAHLNRAGQPLWQRGFHDHAVRAEEDLLSMARYVIANPLRAGLVEDIGQYSLWDAMWL